MWYIQGNSLAVQSLGLSTFTMVALVQSLVRELRSHKPCSVAKKKKKIIYILYIYNGILLRHKKELNLPFAPTWMDLEGIMLSEISQTQKDKYCIFSLICGI